MNEDKSTLTGSDSDDKSAIDAAESAPGLKPITRPILRNPRMIVNREPEVVGQPIHGGPSTSASIRDYEERWIIPSVLPKGGAMGFIVEHAGTAQKLASFLASSCVGHTTDPFTWTSRQVCQFHVATTRMNSVDRGTFDEFDKPAAKIFSKVYAIGKTIHVPLSSPGLVDRIRDDIAQKLHANNSDAPEAPQLCLFQVPFGEVLTDGNGVSVFINELAAPLPGVSVSLSVVGPLDPSRMPVGLFDSIFVVREYGAEGLQASFSLMLHQSRYLSPHAFPPKIVTLSSPGIWQTSLFISDDADIRDMVDRYNAGDSLAAIGESYGIGKGQVSKLLKPLRLSGLLKTTH